MRYRLTDDGDLKNRAKAKSPLLANIYMNRFLKHWRRSGRGEMFRALPMTVCHERTDGDVSAELRER
jgi:hypothetical protein